MGLTRKKPLARSTKPIARSRPMGYWKSRTMGGVKKVATRKTTPEKRADTAFSLALRRERGRCEDDRPEHTCKGRLELCHGHERWHRATRFDERNVFVLCAGAHFWYGMHPLVWDEFMRHKMGDEYEVVRLLALNAGRAAPKNDHAALVTTYSARAKAAA